MLLVVSAHGQDSIIDNELQRPHHVGPLIYNVAGLVKRIGAADKAKLVYDCLEFVCATMNITYV